MTDTAERVATWEKPGPGSWQLDSSHARPAPGPIQRDLYEECFEAGMRDGFGLFGAPLSHMEMRWVNGKFYLRLVPIVGGTKDLPPPPMPVLWLAARLHPALRREERKAKESFETKRWRSELARWESEWKPALVAANRAFTAVEVGSLDDPELAAHLRAVHEHLREHTRLHFRLHVSDMGPLGMLMVDLEDWGLHRDDTFRALVAASPATRAPAEQLHEVAAAVRDAGVDPVSLTSLDQVRGASPQARTRLEEYLADHGWRLTTGYDIEDACLAELPEVLLASIRSAAGPPAAGPDHLGPLDALRDEVPAEHRAEFDDAVEDARLSYGLRDENGPLTYEWPAGLMRRALLEAGRRLEAAGPLAARDDVFELRADEVGALLTGQAGPDHDEIASRAGIRRWEATLDAPAHLGREEAPPPLRALTPYLARITRVVVTVVSALEAEAGSAPLTGMGIGTEPYVGTARVVHDATEALLEMEPGDVIIAPYTAPTYNCVLAMAGAVVTEEGGLLCHAAVIARELGLPAVIGAQGAMSIPNGARVEVDPTTGRVRTL
jgi:pyruvate,water dikinase